MSLLYKVQHPETKLLLKVIANVLNRPEIKDQEITMILPKNKFFGEFSGKCVRAPLKVIILAAFKKITTPRLKKILDDNNLIVRLFLEELSKELVKSDVAVSGSTTKTDEDMLRKLVENEDEDK